MAFSILVADDEESIRSMVCGYLERLGFHTIAVSDGREVLRAMASAPPDLLLLDVMMPGLDGFEVAKSLMNRTQVPILFMTARAEEADRVLGLELGADDYITKPFSLREVAARIQAVLRRVKRAGPVPSGAGSPEATLRWKDLEVDVDGVRVRRSGVRVELTTVQFQVLVLFLRSPGRAFTRAQIFEGVRQLSSEGYERTIDVHVKNLRKALGDDAAAPRYIETLRGLGYRLVAE
jgi:DNA-binding response OmpR family regulator